MRIYEFNEVDVKRLATLFDEAIESDRNVYFHGTDSAAHSAICTTGLAPNGSCVSKDEILEVCNIYERMNWCGSNGGGFSALKPFSLQFDHRDGRESPLYLAETSLRAALYASRDFAGGEKARAVRKSIRDLQQYCDDEALRDAHLQLLIQECDYTGRDSANIRQVDLQWLKSEVLALGDLLTKSLAPLERYKHGVVYAVRIGEDIIQKSEQNPNMGLLVFDALSVNHIVACVEIPGSFDPLTPKLMGLEGQRRISRLHNP